MNLNLNLKPRPKENSVPLMIWSKDSWQVCQNFGIIGLLSRNARIIASAQAQCSA